MYVFDPERTAKAQALEAEGILPYPHDLHTTHSADSIRAAVAAQSTEDLPALGDGFCFGGRLMFKNEMGKAGFGRVLDGSTEPLQIYVRRDDVGEAAFAVWKKLDVGDVVWARGNLMRTRTGELSLHARAIQLAAKCVRSLPDKFHGLSDPEIRQRLRYVDLFSNEDSRRVFLIRSKVVRYVRRFFEDAGYAEVETPMMHPIVGGATARPFVTHHNALDMALYLRIAPELYLKRLVVGGMERVFEINRNFRNEGIDQTHNPEFTMLEFYQAWATWQDLCELTERLIEGLAEHLHGTTSLPFGASTIHFARPWARREYGQLVAEALQISREEADDIDAIRTAFVKLHPNADPNKAPSTVGKWWEHVFDLYVEKTLIQPTFVTHYPIEISPLARRNDHNPNLADRFEFFVAGREIGNGFNELNDPVDQAARFTAQMQAKAKGDDEAMHFDADYIDALCFGMPPTAGEGIGIDRLVMLMTNCQSIRDVILFPTRRRQQVDAV